MTAREVLTLNTTTPQIEVPQSGDTYTLPRATGVTGDLTVTSGNTVIATAGKGIDFSANTNAAGMTSELLTWYEEGAWTPTIGYDTNGTLSVSYSQQVGQYTRIGRQVTATFYLALSAFTKGTASGALRVNGLPFTSKDVAYLVCTGALGASNAVITAGRWPIMRVDNNTNYIKLMALVSNSATVALDDPDADAVYWGTISYFV